MKSSSDGAQPNQNLAQCPPRSETAGCFVRWTMIGAQPFYDAAQNMLDYLLGNSNVKEMMKLNPAANARTLAGDTVLPVPKAIFGATVKS